MPLLPVANNVTVKELYKGRAKFGCPSEVDWEEEGWLFTVAKGIVTIQEHVSQDGSVYVVGWRNYRGVDRFIGRILHGLPIFRRNKCVYFKTSSTTIRGNRRTATFDLKFETVEKADEFEVFWLSLNGTIGDDDDQDRNKMPAVRSASTVPSSCTTRLRPQQIVPPPAQANAAPSPNDVASPANTATVSAALLQLQQQFLLLLFLLVVIILLILISIISIITISPDL
jgi:hypothetical protein